MQQVTEELGAECLGLDDFVRPEAEWSSREKPSFPFDFVRYDEFVDAVRSLAHNRRCLFYPYNWETGRVEDLPEMVRGDGIALVEGVSTLHPDLAPLYDLRIWIEGDAETTLAASLQRGGEGGLTNGSSCSCPASNSTSRPILRLGLIWLRAAGARIEVSRGENYGRPEFERSLIRKLALPPLGVPAAPEAVHQS